MCIEEIDGEDETNSQKGFIAMDDCCDVNDPSGNNMRKEFRHPQDEAGTPDHCNPSKNRKIV